MNSPFSNQRNDHGHESLLSMADLNHAATLVAEAVSDPLERFPQLRDLVSHVCIENIGLELVANGCDPVLAARAAKKAYGLVTLATIAVHSAVWAAVLPSTEDELQS